MYKVRKNFPNFGGFFAITAWSRLEIKQLLVCYYTTHCWTILFAGTSEKHSARFSAAVYDRKPCSDDGPDDDDIVLTSVYNCIVDDHRLAQLSSFLRVGPISSHNLSGPLLKMEESCTIHCEHRGWDLKKWFNPTVAKLYLEKRTYFISSNNYEFMNEYCIE